MEIEMIRISNDKDFSDQQQSFGLKKNEMEIEEDIKSKFPLFLD
jgi:hypothetical protein